MNLELYFILDLLVLGFSSIISLFLLAKDKRKALLFIIIPIIVICCFNAYNNVHSLLGLSRPGYLPLERVMILQVAIEGEKSIHIWYVDEKINQPRAIKIPYSEENKKAVEQIAERMKEGQNVFAEFESKPGNGSTSYGVTIKQYNFSNTFQNKKTH